MQKRKNQETHLFGAESAVRVEIHVLRGSWIATVLDLRMCSVESLLDCTCTWAILQGKTVLNLLRPLKSDDMLSAVATNVQLLNPDELPWSLRLILWPGRLPSMHTLNVVLEFVIEPRAPMIHGFQDLLLHYFPELCLTLVNFPSTRRAAQTSTDILQNRLWVSPRVAEAIHLTVL
mmetsp:Transcript_113868/g.221057  ORF Transcript_113868/g.221057 Transcript_113868/m.221057 type:complete len:176 (-) Transcript_113868:1183-1710(-)